ncbi:Maf family protein [Bacillus weihaiensis]|uniref:Maf family protein n=1 Tax=Bacillus weihaiensis TaxID=1547283 RepID=UPI002353CB80|nr:Maf family protein [Bacillus weihaiensis]
MTQNLILASASPRRKELLALLRLPFEIIPSSIEEIIDVNLDPADMVKSLAEQKAKSVAEQHKNSYVIGSDTLVVYEGKMLGKPKTEAEAIDMLQLLSAKSHDVYTGVSICYQGRMRTFYEKTTVTFYPLSLKEMEDYVRTGEPMDKAGGYGIQGYGALLVKELHGDYYSVVGLPVARLKRELEEIGFHQ